MKILKLTLSFIILFFLACAFVSTANAEEFVYRKPLPSLPITFNTKHFDDSYSLIVCSQIFDRLFEVDDLQNLKGHLVNKWESSAGGKVWTLYLKDGVYFHNGKLLTADDVIFTLTRLLEKDSLRYYDLSIIQGAEEYADGKAKKVAGLRTLSTNSLQIVLKYPFPPFLFMLTASNTEIIPYKYAGQSEDDFFKHPIGTGPFIFESYTPSSSVTIKSNKNYFLGKPYLDKIIFIKSNAQKALEEFNKGYYQDIEWYFDIDTKSVQSKFTLLKTLVPNTNIFLFNLSKSPLDNLHIRKAIFYAINKKEIIDECYPDQLPANGIVPPGIGGYFPDLKSLPYDLTKANDEIRKSGLSKKQIARPLIILRPNNHPCMQKFGPIINKNLARIGLNVNVKYLPLAEIDVGYYSNRNFDIVNYNISSDFPEALFSLNLLRHDHPRNYQGINSKKIDELLTRASQTEDRYARYNIYKETQEIVQNEALILPIFHWIFEGIYQSYVKGVELSPYAMLNPSMRTIYYDSTYKP